MSPMPGRNPYRPGVGLTPLYLAGRDDELRRFRSVLRGAPDIPANVRITGLRGVGKTVLLGEFQRIAAEERWDSDMMEVEHRHDETPGLTAALTALCTRAQARISRSVRLRRQMGRAVEQISKIEVEFNDVRLGFDPGAPDADIELAEVLWDTVVASVSRGRNGFALLLDEVQVLEDPAALSMLIAATSALQRTEVPIAVVLAGLPHLTANLLKARTYSERLFRGEILGPLDADAAGDALVRPLDDTGVEIDAGLVHRVVDEVSGYPYFVQLWGAELWDAADHADVQHLGRELFEVVAPEIRRRLDTDFYEPRVQILTPAEQDVLLATRDCPYPPLRVADIVERSDKSMGNVNVLLGRMVQAGVIYRLRRGEYDYTAPRFHEFLQRRPG